MPMYADVSHSNPICGAPARRGLFKRVRRALELRRQRRDLARLDTHLLTDIGLTRDEAEREAAKPVWDAPDHWFK